MKGHLNKKNSSRLLFDIAESKEMQNEPSTRQRRKSTFAANAIIHETETLNEAMHCDDDHVPTYRDYLHAQRDLKSLRGGFISQRSMINATGEIIELTKLENETTSTTTQQQQQPQAVSTLDDEDQQQEQETKLRTQRQQQSDEAYRQTIKNVATAGRRASIMSADTTLWDTLLEMDEDMDLKEHLEMEHDDDPNNKNDHHHAGIIPWYSPPMQRVFYGKPQVLPHVNWGDLFFDLFFVAAAYNLGVLLISAMNSEDWLRGLIYFIGIFGALYQTWYNDLSFSSRYTVVDHVHRLIGFMKFFCVAIAIMFIKPLSFMGDPKSVETLAFMIAITSESIISFSLSLEIYYRAIGDRIPIEKHTKRMIRNFHLPTLAFYAVALTLAAIAFFGEDEDSSSYDDDTATNTTTTDITDLGNETDRLLASSNVECSAGSRLLLSRMLGASSVDCDEEGRRFLASPTGADACTCHTGIKLTMDDLPLGIVTFTYIFNIAFSFVRSFCLAGQVTKDKDIRDRFVPNNLDYLIHRYGEWILLMIGEGVLSLLIVETTESREYFIVSCFGVLTVMGIHILVFESQPSTSQGHAIYRSLRAQMIFGLLVQILSMGLIAFGVCFKIMLTTIVLEEDSYRRSLAETPAVSNEATTALFSGSLTIILLSLELMLATHKGAKGLYKHHFKKRDGGDLGIIRKVNKPLVALSLIRIGLIVFSGTISQWERELTEIAMIAFFIVAAMSVCRVIGWGLVHKEDEIRLMLKKVVKAPKNAADSMNVMKKHVTKKIKRIGSKVSSSSLSNSWRGAYGVEGIDDPDTSTNRDEDDEATQQQQQRAEWRSSFRPAWDSSFDCIVVIDRSGIIQYANSTAVNEFRYDSEEELIGKDIAILTGGGEAKNHHRYMTKMEDGREPSKFIGQDRAATGQDAKQRILHARRKDDSEFPCMIGLKSVPDSELIAGFIRNLSNLAGMEQFTKEEFMNAASTGDFDEVKLLLSDNTVHINEGDYDMRRALHLAAGNGHDDVVQLLCDVGADTNVEDRWGNHPLDDAMAGHHTECIRILKSCGASRGQVGGIPEFVSAAARGDAEEVQALIDEGNVNIDEGVHDGRSALHLAVSEGHSSVVKVLCEAGANVNAPDRWNHRPLDEAERSQEKACATILKDFGAENGSGSISKNIVESAGGQFDASFDAIVVSDYQGTIKQVNQTTLESFGYSASDELVGQNVSVVVGGDHAKNHDKYMENFNKAEKTSSVLGKQRILYGQRKDGTEFPCIIMVKRNQKQNCFVASIRDMSDLRDEGAITISSAFSVETNESVDSARSA